MKKWPVFQGLLAGIVGSIVCLATEFLFQTQKLELAIANTRCPPPPVGGSIRFHGFSLKFDNHCLK